MTRSSFAAFPKKMIYLKEHSFPHTGQAPSSWESAGKNVSVLRACTSPSDIFRRAQAHNREDDWKTDPVIAKCQTVFIRQVVDLKGRRDLCIYADPTSDKNDVLGACPTHAGIVRSTNPPKPFQRTELLTTRMALSAIFQVMAFSQSGISLVEPPEFAEPNLSESAETLTDGSQDN